MVEITDEESARAWLETQDHQTQVWMAARSALRVFSGIAVSQNNAVEPKRDIRAFYCLKLLLLTTAHATELVVNDREKGDNAQNVLLANFSGDYPPGAFSSSAVNAINSARGVAGLAATGDIAYHIDLIRFGFSNFTTASDSCRVFALAKDAISREGWPKLWQIDTAPVADLLALWPPLKARFEADPDWRFWAWWYQSLFDGNPPQKLWDLTQRIAREVTEDQWDWDNGKGPAKVAARIREFEDEWAAKNLPQVETLVKSEVTGLYDVVASAISPPDQLASIVAQVGFALETAVRNNASGLNPFCVPYRYIRYACDECPEDANTVEQHFTFAASALEKGLAKGKYQEDEGIEELAASLRRHALQLRSDHPEVGQAYVTRVAQTFRELEDGAALKLAEAAGEYADTTEGRLEQETRLDQQTLSSDEPPEVKAEAVKRVVGRAAKQSMLERASETVKAADKSGGVVSAKLAYGAYKIVEVVRAFLI